METKSGREAAFEYGKYANKLLSGFGAKHMGCDFDNIMGINSTGSTTSTFRNGTIRIDLGNKLVVDEPERIAAGKIMIGHEISHHVLRGMNHTKMVKELKRTVKYGKDKEELLGCLIESAADIYGAKLFISYGGKIDDATYGILLRAFKGFVKYKDPAAEVKLSIRSGYLPAVERVDVIKKYIDQPVPNSRNYGDYIDHIGQRYSELKRQNLNQSIDSLEDLKIWLKAILEVNDFMKPARIR